MRDSEWMETMTPRWAGEETSSLKALRSSLETEIPDCIAGDYWLFDALTLEKAEGAPRKQSRGISTR